MLTEDQLIEARHKLSAGRIIAYREMPYYTRALLAIEVFERPGMKTFGVDKYWRLYYDPQKCLEWTVREIAAVWLHEVNHLIRKHNERWEALEGIGHDHETFNRAADASINTDLKSQGIILPNPELRVYIDSKLSPKWNQKMTAEQLYWEAMSSNRKKQALEEKKKEEAEKAAESDESDDNAESPMELPDEDDNAAEGGSGLPDGVDEEEQEEEGSENDESDSDSENSDSLDGDSPHEEDGDAKDDEGTSPNGNGEPEDDETDPSEGNDQSSDSGEDGDSDLNEDPSDSDSDSDSDSEGSDSGEQQDSDSGGEQNEGGDPSGEKDEGGESSGEATGSSMPDSDCGSCVGGEQREYEETTEKGALDPSTAEWIRHKTAEDIVDYAERNPGSVPGDVVREAQYIIEPQVDWREEFRSFFRRTLSNVSGYHDYTYARPSRRGGLTNVIMPSLRAPAPPELAAVLDTSGSMREEVEIAAALGELEELLARFGQSNNGGRGMHIVSCDAGATDALVKNLRDFQVIGGGGTDMRVGIEHAANLRPRMDVIVTVTDGGTPWPEEKPVANLMAHYVVLLVMGYEGGWRALKDIPEWMHVIQVQISDRKRPK